MAENEREKKVVYEHKEERRRKKEGKKHDEVGFLRVSRRNGGMEGGR